MKMKFLNAYRLLQTIYRRNHTSQTIFALSSGYGKCGVAVIRISGSKANDAIINMTTMNEIPRARVANLRYIKDPYTKDVLDKGLVLWFPAPHSFTGEDCCEFQVHGSLAVVDGILSALASLPNYRLAKPGEFSRRAFENGKLDLTEVEGLADLLQAETQYQRKQAFLQSEGVLKKLYNKWRKSLIRLVAHIEARIDFEQSECISSDEFVETIEEVKLLHKNISDHLNNGYKGEMLRNGVKVVILGEPNVGKSSLLNLLCERPAAIVTPFAGTTRDVLNVTLNVGGYPMMLADTAGLRLNTNDLIEREGMERAFQQYQEANLIILVVDYFKYYQTTNENSPKKLINYLKNMIKTIGLNDLLDPTAEDMNSLFRKNCLLVFNKIDLVRENGSQKPKSENIVYLSCQDQNGLEDLVSNLINKLKDLCGDPSTEHPSMSQARHRIHLSNCLHELDKFISYVNNSNKRDEALLAEYLRSAIKHLGHLVGIVTNEQLLDVIFKDFCIGK